MTSDEEENGCVYLEKKEIVKYSPNELVRPLVLTETISALAGEKMDNDLNTIQLVWLESKHPIDPELVKKAIGLLAKSNSILQMCVVKHKGSLWFKRMKQTQVDFDTTDDDYMDVYNDLMKKPYDMKNGPLWRVRFISSTKKNNEMPYSSVIVYAVQHCITDGATCMIYIRETVRLLNCLAGGKPVKLVPSGLSPTIPETVKTKSSLRLILKTFFEEMKENFIKDYSAVTTFNNLLPKPVTKIPTTKLFLDDLTVEETSKLLAKCKLEKITVHTLISSCCSLALLKLSQTLSEKEIGEKVIKLNHCIDGRRYFKNFDKTTSGCHLLVQFQRIKFALKGDFWESARMLQADLKKTIIEEEMPMKLLPLSPFIMFHYYLNYFLTSRSAPHRTTCHFITTNMGNLKDHLPPEPDETDMVDIKYIVRSVKNEFSGIPFMIGFQTFRNRFLINMDCYTSKMPEDLGKKYFSILCSLIRNLANKGSIE